jgi:hypothetical protein
VSGAAGFVFRRAAAQRLVLAAGFATMLLATTLLAGTQMYAAAVTTGGLAQVLGAAPLPDRAAQLVASLPAKQWPGRDSDVREAAREAFPRLGVDVFSSAVSASYALPGGDPDRPDLTVFAAYADLPAHADLADGRWPAPAGGSGRIHVALPLGAAESLDLQVGDQLAVTGRSDERAVDIEVSATYRLRDPTSAYWFGDQLDTRGIRVSSFATYGPLAVSQQTLTELAGGALTARWRIRPHVEAVTPGMLPDLQRGAAALDGDPRLAGTLQTGLPDLLTRTGRALLVARSAILVPVAQLVLLAGYALLLTARLLGEHRRGESALLRARGASASQHAGHAFREGVLLAMAATVLAPPLALVGLRALNAAWSTADIGLSLDASITPFTWVVAALAAGACALALVVPTLRRPATYVETQQARSRQSRRSVIQRAGGDLVLLAVAGLALWQLTRYGSPLLVDATGRLGIDPLLVAGPALALLAGSVLALRIIPALSGRAEYVGVRLPGLAPALGAWQVGRRPQRYAGPALLLVMALSIGALSVTYAATWRQSQRDQADFRAGADLRVEAPFGPRALLPLGRAAAYAGLPGVTTAMPVYRGDVDVSTLDADLVALDAAQAKDVVTFRPNLADRSWPQLLEPLAAGRAVQSGISVPGEPDSLRVLFRADSRKGRVDQLDLALVLKDKSGLLHRMTLGSVPTGDRAHSRVADLREAAGDGAGLAYPLTLLAVEAGYVLPSSSRSNGGDTLTLTVDAIMTSDDGMLAPPGHVSTRSSTNGRQDDSPMVAKGSATEEESFLDLQIETGSTTTFDRRTDVTVVAEFVPPGGRQPLSALLDRAAAGTAGLAVGDGLAVRVGGESYNLSVQGVVDGVPTVAPGRGAVVVDLPSLAARHYTTTGDLLEADEWWLDVADDPESAPPEAAAAATALRQRPDLGGGIVDRLALRRELQTDPLGLAVVGALAIGFVAAAAFAAVGFAVNAAVSARERLGELALLRALGAAPGQLFGLLAVEQAFLVGLGCLAGVALGVLIARLVVPLVLLTAQATRAVPPVVVDVPWPAVLGLAAALALVLALVVLVLGAGVRRLAVARTLRLGEDR